MDELDQRVRASAAPPQGDFDAADVARRVGRRRRQRQVGTGLGATVLVALAALGAVAVLDGDGHQVALDDATHGHRTDSREDKDTSYDQADESLDEDDVEILAVRNDVPGTINRLITDQAQLDDVWSQLELDGSAPVLSPQQDALFMVVRGDCGASHVGGMQRIPAVDRPGDLAVLNLDESCVNTEYGRLGGAYDGPHTLYVIGAPSRLDLAGAEVVTASVSDLEWEIVTITQAPRREARPAAPRDQSSLNYFWRNDHLDGSPPDLPDGWIMILLPVPGTCNQESQLRGVEVVGEMLNDDNRYDEVPSLQTAVYFDPGCAEVRDDASTDPLSLQPVYSIVVPERFGFTLGSPRAYITCASNKDADECQGDDRPIDMRTGQRAQMSASAGPQPSAAETPTGSDDARRQATHVVERGDTLSGLAQAYYGNAYAQHREAILQANDMESPGSLEVGQELIIPPDPTG